MMKEESDSLNLGEKQYPTCDHLTALAAAGAGMVVMESGDGGASNWPMGLVAWGGGMARARQARPPPSTASNASPINTADLRASDAATLTPGI